MALTKINYTGQGVVPHAKMPSGSVLQVQSTHFTNRLDINSSGDTTLFSVSITPKFSTSKILVRISLCITHRNLYSALVRCSRAISGGATTQIGGGTASGNKIAGVWMNVRKAHLGNSSQTLDVYSYHTYSNEHLDSPSTTSAITYNVQGRSANGGANLYLNRTDDNSDQQYNSFGGSVITATEIAA
tara:strand:+ start:1192 stop:1752 length:561 start_codon:yes stop_codon:yes gene_type:complete